MGHQIHTMFRQFGSQVSQELQQTRDNRQQASKNGMPVLVSPATDPTSTHPSRSVRQFVPIVDTTPQRATGAKSFECKE